MSIKINVTQGDFRKKRPEKRVDPKKNLNIAMQISALNKIAFAPEKEETMKGIEFFGYISGTEHETEFYYFDDPVVKKGELEMKYILGKGDLAAFRMAGGNQLMFAGRAGREEMFRVVAKAKIDGREISFRDCQASSGEITLGFRNGMDVEKVKINCIL